MTEGRGPDGVVDAVGMEAHDSPVGKAAHAVVGALPDVLAKPMTDKMALDRMGALRTAIKAVRRGGTVSVSGVYGGEVDPMPMMEMFDRGITMRMGQCHVKRWVDDIMPAVAGRLRPARHAGHDHAPPAAGPGAGGLRHLPEEARRLHQGGPQAVRTVVVVGASSGIGRATAHQLASRGDQLVLAARSVDALEETRQECVARGASGVLVVPTDVGDREQVTRLFDESVARFDRVDVVVHAAAVLAYGRFEDVPPDVFDKILQTNLVGTANVARSTLKVFDAQQGGSLVVVGSVLAKMVAPYLSSYSTGKWGVQGLVRTLQIEARAKPGVHDQPGLAGGRGHADLRPGRQLHRPSGAPAAAGGVARAGGPSRGVGGRQARTRHLRRPAQLGDGGGVPARPRGVRRCSSAR